MLKHVKCLSSVAVATTKSLFTCAIALFIVMLASSISLCAIAHVSGHGLPLLLDADVLVVFSLLFCVKACRLRNLQHYHPFICSSFKFLIHFIHSSLHLLLNFESLALDAQYNVGSKAQFLIHLRPGHSMQYFAVVKLLISIHGKHCHFFLF